jgi:diacylglycerol O-acyltransferase
MSYSHHERLSIADASFLDLENANAHMHIGSVAIFDAEPLTAEHGGIDIDRILVFINAALRRNVRFQQKIAFVPILGHPVWIDDESFHLNYHVRHSCLPAPGDIRRLKRLAGRIMSQKLDRGKPLWELWLVEGLEGGRFALISKIHRCLTHNGAGIDLLSAIMGSDPDYEARPVGDWIPRPASSARRLIADELRRRASLPVRALNAAGRVLADPGDKLDLAREAVVGLGQVAATGLKPASETPFNAALGPHRRLDWTRFDLETATQVNARLGGEVDDVALATVAGAARRFLHGRGIRPEDLDCRVIVSSNVHNDVHNDAHDDTERGDFGARISSLLARLPIDEPDPIKRLQRVVDLRQGRGRSTKGRAGDALAQVGDWTFGGVMAQLARLGLWNRTANFAVTNVPGPQVPIYMLGAPLLEAYAIVPLMADQALGITLFSCTGGLHGGFNSDWDALPDLHAFVEAIQLEFEELSKVAAAVPISVGKGPKKGTRARKRTK